MILDGENPDENTELLTKIVQNSIQYAEFSNCPTEWVPIMDSCIWLSSEAVDFETATEKCIEMEGARLYEPQTKLHNQLVFTLMKEKGVEGHNHYIGIHDKIEENS